MLHFFRPNGKAFKLKLLVFLSNLLLCRLVRAAHGKGANIILIQVCTLGTCDIQSKSLQFMALLETILLRKYLVNASSELHHHLCFFVLISVSLVRI
jgi:hypothetical protein